MEGKRARQRDKQNVHKKLNDEGKRKKDESRMTLSIELGRDWENERENERARGRP